MPVTNLTNFQRDMTEFQREQVEAHGLRLLRSVSAATLAGVVQKTPVVTGYTRGNWQISIGAEIGTAIDAPDPSGASTIARGVGKLAGLQLGQTVYVVNNAPHIGQIEYGSDTQAPRPMVAPTLEEVSARFEAVEVVL